MKNERESGMELTADCIANVNQAGIGRHGRPGRHLEPAGEALTVAGLGSLTA